MKASHALSPSDAAVLETFVVPRYLALFGSLALEMLVASDGAAVAHLGCRTGYPARELADRLPGGSLAGVDPSPAAVELARTKGAMLSEFRTDYDVYEGFPTPLPAQSFSHAMAICPIGSVDDRHALIGEMARLVLPRGQALLAMPLRGSFPEVSDLLREYALKHDAGDIGKAVELAVAERPTLEILTDELEAAGFDDVDVEMVPAALEFQSGRDFLEDPITRIVLAADLRASLKIGEVTAPLAYVREAIDRYWSEEPFRLSVHVGCASARRPLAGGQ